MSGLSKLAAYGPITEKIAAVRLPLPPLAFAVAVAVELGGGLLLVLGYRVRPVALALAAFSLATAVSFHSNFADQNQMIHFLKNVMMAGGYCKSPPSGPERSASSSGAARAQRPPETLQTGDPVRQASAASSTARPAVAGP